MNSHKGPRYHEGSTRVSGFGSRILGFGFGVWGVETVDLLGFRVWGLET